MTSCLRRVNGFTLVWMEAITVLAKNGELVGTMPQMHSSRSLPLLQRRRKCWMALLCLISWHGRKKISACPPEQECNMPGSRGTSLATRYMLSEPLSAYNAPQTIQFTVGLPLNKVPDLFALSPDSDLKVVTRTVKAMTLCKQRCSPEYNALVSMASMTILGANRYNRAKQCDHPKLYMVPWLVRSHFGDMARRLPSEELPHLSNDVLQVVHHTHKIASDKPLFSRKFFDYLLFPEFAALGGVVQGRRHVGNESSVPENACASIRAP